MKQTLSVLFEEFILKLIEDGQTVINPSAVTKFETLSELLGEVEELEEFYNMDIEDNMASIKRALGEIGEVLMK